MARCTCEHEHAQHRRDTGECQECRCNECNCDKCCPDARENPGCNCENETCQHSREHRGCGNTVYPDSVRALDIGRICAECAVRMPRKYLRHAFEINPAPPGHAVKASAKSGCAECNSTSSIGWLMPCGLRIEYCSRHGGFREADRDANRHERSCAQCNEPGNDYRDHIGNHGVAGRGNPSPASKTEDEDVPFSVADAERMLDVFVSMEQAQLIDEHNHTAPLVRNVYLDLQKWNREPVGPFRTSRGEEIRPAVYGVGWDVLRRALDQWETNILFAREATYKPGDRAPANPSKADTARYKLMQDMSWIDDLWRRKLAMARLSTVVRYGTLR